MDWFYIVRGMCNNSHVIQTLDSKKWLAFYWAFLQYMAFFLSELVEPPRKCGESQIILHIEEKRFGMHI